MCKGGNPNKIGNLANLRKYAQPCILPNIQFNFVLFWFFFGAFRMKNNHNRFWGGGDWLLTISHWKKPYSKLFSGIKFLFVIKLKFQNFCFTF